MEPSALGRRREGSPVMSPVSPRPNRLPSLHRRGSREDSVTMTHATPDLQAIQGAYVSNVERLEQHAERLSFKSDLAEELPRLKGFHQQQHNNHSTSLESAESRRRAGSRATSGLNLAATGLVNGNDQEDNPLANRSQGSKRPSIQLPNTLRVPDSYSGKTSPVAIRETAFGSITASADVGQLYDLTASDVWRSPSLASRATFQQAEEVFTEFDGTYMEESKRSTERDGVDVREAEETPYINTETTEMNQAGLLYYPAPIPVMLKLPPKLSKNTRVKSATCDGAIKDLPGHEIRENKHHPRASDPRASDNNDIKPYQNKSDVPALRKLNDSAVKTLDRLLNASVHAPVGAFTDHPIVGSSGADIYRASGVLKQDRNSGLTSSLIPDGGTQIPPSGTFSTTHKETMRENTALSLNDAMPSETEPTTLLSEIESRKQQQHSRNKSAADTFPEGMHATLLQLDEVAQRQRDSRKMKPTTLAWETRAGLEEVDSRNEDAPLAYLPCMQNREMTAHPQPVLGLQERKRLDDTEPLSIRRARLRGYGPESQALVDNAIGDPVVRQSGIIKNDNIDGNLETLAQRKRRLHFEGAIRTDRLVSGELTSEMRGEFGVPAAQSMVVTSTDRFVGDWLPSGDDEILAHRRLRLRMASPSEKH